MGKYQLVEYRPNRWIKVDPQAGVVGPATPQEVAAWLAAREAAQAEAAPPQAAPPAEPPKPAPDTQTPPPGEPDSHGTSQKPGPKPEEPEPGKPEEPAPAKPEEPAPAKPEEPTPAEPEEPAPVKPQKPEPAKPQGPGPFRPLAGRYRITSTFADHQNRNPPSTAPGIDFGCALGTEVRAWTAGRVVRSRWSDGGGRCLWIEHAGAIRTYYAHLSSVAALEGETVAAGQKIGESGSTGHSTGPHLHFSVVRGGSYVDPAKFLPPEESGT
jgi:murein DD-endopeptidase MepM/ murein hydrolase activator NlpD